MNMNRKKAIECILDMLNKNEVLIVSNGMISRDVYFIKDRPLNFYMLGSMGCALAIGIGVAYSRPDLFVNVLVGDGAALMGLNTFALHNDLKLHNLTCIVLNNYCHATTGGQEVCSKDYDFEQYWQTYEYLCTPELLDSPRIPLTPIQIKERFVHALSNIPKK